MVYEILLSVSIYQKFIEIFASLLEFEDTGSRDGFKSWRNKYDN